MNENAKMVDFIDIKKKSALSSSLPHGEEGEINLDQSVTYELNEMQLKMMKVGASTNIITGLFVIWMLHTQVPLPLLLTWYSALFFTSLIEIIFSFYYQRSRVKPHQMKPWLAVYHCILIPICLVWGSMSVVFEINSIQYLLYTMTFLQVVLFGFSMATLTDFKANAISTVCLVLPYLVYHSFYSLHAMMTSGAPARLTLGFSLSLFILATFLLITSYIGNNLIKKSFKLTFENVALNKKLEQANAFLEDRVKERTIELEDSLKLVTYQATHDLLTDLPNQRLLQEYFEKATVSANQNNRSFAVACFVLNEIQKIDDGFGHETADSVIKTVARRFKKSFDKNIGAVHYTITLSRKDIFVILIEFLDDTNDIEKAVQPLFFILDETIRVKKQSVKLTASIGASMYPKDGHQSKLLLMNATSAMLRAKEMGGNNINIFSTKNNIDVAEQLALERDLHIALKNNEFILHYQPVVDLKTGKVCSVEALLRWNHPSLGMISPGKFIPLAENNGIIIPLGEWAFRTACMQTKIWHDQGFTALKVAINLSSKQLRRKDIVQTFAHILKTTQLSPAHVELELTESEAFLNETIPIVKQLKAMGLSLAIDDFGTGYSGLSNLKLFDIDKLKIDQSFIRDVATNEDSRAIVENTIALAKKINVKVLAEGVETKEQLSFLQRAGCHLIQGYYFSKPIETKELTQLLKHKWEEETVS
ncbi:MAG TPA: bifunctional diguanylate cyclase/phosphodiesterase [Gammaproteobacteria bacterium]|nr:bifunctional diguanylate cyclase/phosphodiesterase [Gammaproteobacteria bacterium]